MGLAKNMKLEEGDRKRRLTQRKLTFASFRGMNVNLLAEVVCAATEAGDALMFGRTRDETAVTITLYSGGNKYPQYCADAAAVDTALAAIREEYQDA